MEKAHNEILSALLTDIKPKIGEDAFKDWFGGADIQYNNGYVLVFPNKFVSEWVGNHYLGYINESAEKIGISIKIGIINQQIEVQKEKSNQKFSEDYTFENFVVGKSNEMAYEAAKRIASNTQIVFNPLFIYGNVGLGKTHLMNAIAHYRAKQFPEQKIAYLSAEKFMTSFIKAIQQKSVMGFKDEFRSVDMLLIDDFQFLGSKEATQEEFFHTFNILLEQKKQLIISADQPPSSLPGVEARLSSRLGWGLVVDIHPPTFELRVSILKAKAEKLGVEIEEEIIHYIAEISRNSIRELEGALIRVVKQSEWMNIPLTLTLAETVLQNFQNSKPKNAEEILKKMCKLMEMELETLQGSSRQRPIVRARQKAVYLLRSLTGISYTQIAKMIGNKDHTSIMYAETQAKKLKKEDPIFQSEIEKLEKELK